MKDDNTAFLEIRPDTDAQRHRDNPFIFDHRSLRDYREGILRVVELIQRKMSVVDKPFSGVLPHELAVKFENVDLDRPFAQLSDALAEIEELYLKDAIYFHHPRYVAHLNCPIVVPAILAEVILSSINSSLDTWDQSAGGTLIEQKLIDWTAEKIGLGPQADGVFTSGGTQSNLMAMLLARDSFCSKQLNGAAKIQGLPEGFRKLRIFASQASHFSVQKSAAILGLGYESVISVACDRHFRMDVRALEREIGNCLARGLTPMAVVATAGTTDFGSIDPMTEIAELCRAHGLWMHADAAYGCGLLVSPRHRHLLCGIEQADSVTVDYHKSFLQPVSCGAFFVKDKKNLSCVTHHAEYLNPTSQLKDGTPNLVNKNIQTTKRFDALKLWLTLRTMGADNIGKAFDRVVDLAKQTYRLFLLDEAIEVIHEPQLSTIVFRYRPLHSHSDEEIDAANAYIRKALFRSGEAVVASTKVEERRYLKFTLLNPTTTSRDIREIASLIKRHGHQYFSHRQKRAANAVAGLMTA
ncbi:MAG: pyridoxal phosphate-dependent decarboxylase family protein [Gammaproteobacteria bacterium]